MRRIAITNQKGGTGKTTTAVSLAAALGELGQEVLLLDIDPQASASSWLGLREDGYGLLDVLNGTNGSISDLVRNTGISGVWCIPASSWLSTAERTLASEIGVETVLASALDRLEGPWSYLLIDCPPSLGLLSIAALTAATEVLVPVEASVMALEGLAELVRTIDKVRERLNGQLAISAVLPVRVDRRTMLSREVISSLRSRFDGLVLSDGIRETVRMREAPSHHEPITVYAPEGPAAADYRAAAAALHGGN